MLKEFGKPNLSHGSLQNQRRPGNYKMSLYGTLIIGSRYWWIGWPSKLLMKSMRNGLLYDFHPYTFSIETIKYYTIVRFPTKLYEIRNIPYGREWHRDWSSVVVVSYVDHLVIGHWCKKNNHGEVLCDTCRMEGHHKNEWPTFKYFLYIARI